MYVVCFFARSHSAFREMPSTAVARPRCLPGSLDDAPDAEGILVNADRRQIGQALLNLVLNAAYALRRAP